MLEKKIFFLDGSNRLDIVFSLKMGQFTEKIVIKKVMR